MLTRAAYNRNGSSRQYAVSGGRPPATRTLFLNTQSRAGADVAVHLSLMRFFDPEETRAWLLSNGMAVDAAAVRAALCDRPDVPIRFRPFGRTDGPVGRIAAIANLWRTCLSFFAAASLARRWRIDVVHATDRPRDAVCAVLLGAVTGARSVVHMHSNCGPHLSRLTRWGFARADAVFAVSEYIARELMASGVDAGKVRVVHNATDADHFAPDAFREVRGEVRARFGIPDGAPVVGIVARINPWKGHRELIEAAALLAEDWPELRLLIAGAGSPWDERAMRDLAAERGLGERAIFAGFHEDVRPLLAAMDVFALPSYEEPFGLAITEAMAMELPVVACRSGGVPEIVTDGHDGRLVEPRSAGALAGALAGLLGDPAERERLGRNARRTVRERFSPVAQSRRVSRLYAGLASAPNAASAPQRRRASRSRGGSAAAAAHVVDPPLTYPET